MNEYLLSQGKISFGGRIYLRAISAADGDGLLVTRWRNEPLAREMFYTQAVVTPDSHADWWASKDIYDQVWMVCRNDDTPVGMASLHIDPAGYTGEYGRVVISPDHRGKGYAKELDYTVMATAFELFELDMLWLEVFVHNQAVVTLHDKTGFKRAGVDVPGHTHPRGPVQYMTIDRQGWAAARSRFYMLIQASMPEWTP